VFFGLESDYDEVPDIDVLAQCISEALAELVDTTTDSRARAPRGRPKAGTGRNGRGATRRPAGKKRTT
jgi:diacylglycerol O-acyltransferase / wax synthase